VVRRAARWDGIVPYKGPGTTGWEDFTPDDIRLMRASIECQRSASTPFDIAIGGQSRGDGWERERALIGELPRQALPGGWKRSSLPTWRRCGPPLGAARCALIEAPKG
jgi:hypothetical protein